MARKFFTDESLSTLVSETKAYADSAIATHSIPVVPMTSADGVAYTATISGIEELTAGMTFMFVPDKTSTATTITLNVNGFGDMIVRRKLSMGTATGSQNGLTTQFYKGRGTLLMFDNAVANNQFWFALDFTKPCASDLYGNVPVQQGGTYVNSETTDEDIAEALEGLGVYSKADQTLSLIYDSGAITEKINAFSNIDVDGYKNLLIAVSCVNDGTNISKSGSAIFKAAQTGRTYQFPVWTNMFSTSTDVVSAGMARFNIMDGYLLCPYASRNIRTSNFFSDTEGGTADNLTSTGSGIMKCTGNITDLTITSLNQDSSCFFGVGSRVMVWGSVI